ncbi:MAG: PQQ-dependent sugar dehydrogenase, partial [Bacteroidota bacterium]
MLQSSFLWKSNRYYFSFLLVSLFLQIGYSQGVSIPSPVAPYLNGVFPEVTPSQGTGPITYTAANAFPNLTFVDPVKILELPGQKFMVIGKSGQVWRFDNQPSTSVKTLLMDIKGQVVIAGDGGMLGGALHPEFGQVASPNRGYFYLVYRYTPAKGTNGNYGYWRLSRFTLEDGATQVDPNSEYVLIQQYDRHDWHNGGDMFFDPDGFLNVIGGDEGGANDQFNVTQQIDKWLFGGIFRIDVDKRGGNISHPIRKQPQNQATPPSGWPNSFTQGYYIPNDNPWLDPNGGILEEFWALGTRSPHRMTYDAPTGEVWIGDIGQASREEISVVAKGDNLQWPYREGNVNGPKAQPANLIGIDKPPVYAYGRSVGRAVIGGFVYRGSKFPELQGKYLFGDHETQNVWSLVRNGNQAPTIEFMLNIPAEGSGGKDGISTFATDSEGNVYIADLYGTDLDGGKIRKLVQTNNIPDPPARLSDLNVFADLSSLTAAAGVIPYTVNAPLWSDRALKKRWIVLPNDGSHNSAAEQIVFDAEDNWKFPQGTVLIKHFELPIDERNPEITRKLETRFFVFTSVGDAYGVTYRWNAAGTEAFLLTNGATDDITVTRADGSSYIQQWTYPSRQECMDCHNANAGFALGVKTRQINGNFTYPGSGTEDNQLHTWNHLGMFTQDIGSPSEYPRSIYLETPGTSDEFKARSYIDGNCSYCHRPNGVNGVFDGRAKTALFSQAMVGTTVISNGSTPGNLIISAGSDVNSELWLRDNSNSSNAMPPVGKSLVHDAYIQSLSTWINSINTSGPASPESGWFMLEARHSGKVVGALGGSTAEGARMVQRSSIDLPSQKWLVQPLGEGLYRLSSQETFKTLSYSAMESDRGHNVTQESFTGAQDQLWYFYETDIGYYNVVNAYNGLHLDVFGGNLGEDERIILWNSNGGGNNQQWRLVPTSGPSSSTDLLAHWSFDGGSLNDVAGLVPDDASVVGQVGLNLSGVNGQAIRIDKEGYLTIPHSQDLLLGGTDYPDFSVAFWLKLEVHNGPWMNLFTKGNGSPRTPGVWINHSTGGIHYRISTTTSSNHGGNANTDLRQRLDEWVHVSYVKEGSQLRLYMNGSLDQSPVNFSGTVRTSANIPLTIGAFENGGDEGVFWMDEVMVFGKALSETEISELASPPDLEAPSIPQNVVASNIGQTDLDLNWSASIDNVGVSGYYIYQNGNSTPIGTVSSTTFNVSGLAPGTTYQFAVAAFDESGNVSTQSQALEVSTNPNQPPVASLIATPISGIAPLLVGFDASASTDPENDSLTYSWDFGDGNSGSDVTPSHTYINPGSFTVILTLDDGQGNLVTASQQIVVEQVQEPSTAFGEVGLASGVDHTWKTITLQRNYSDPVVIAGAPSYFGTNQATVRVQEVSRTSFQVRIDEWECLDGAHGGEDVPYLVVESGVHTLPNGKKLMAGNADAVSNSWFVQSFPEAFRLEPIVFGQIITENEPEAANIRIDHNNTNINQLRLRILEAGTTAHADERVSWLAVEPGVHQSDKLFEGGNTGRGVDENWVDLNFLQSYSPTPIFIGEMGSNYGGDAAAIRYRNLSGNGVQVFVEEETCSDTEIGHTTEEIHYLVFGEPGVIGLPDTLSFCSSPSNLAHNRPTRQSSTYGNGVAALAVDGNLTGTSPWSADLQHTNNEAQPWWEVDLGANSQIDSVNIFNRSDCCQDRLSDFYVLVSDAPMIGDLNSLLADGDISQTFFSGSAGQIARLGVKTEGRYVRIQLSGSSVFHISEVEVMGCNLEQVCESPVVSIDDPGSISEDGQVVQLVGSPGGGVWS